MASHLCAEFGIRPVLSERPNNGVFTSVFTCQHVACEDADRAAYSQLHSHVTGEYSRQQAGISCQNHRNVAHCPVYISVPTRTDLPVQVCTFFKNLFLYGFFQKYGFLDFCTDFF